MTWPAFSALVSFGGLVLSILAMVFAWFRTKSTKVSERFEVVEGEQRQFNDRLRTVETSVAGLPTQQHLSELRETVARVEGHLGRIEQMIDGDRDIRQRNEASIQRIEDHLLKRKET